MDKAFVLYGRPGSGSLAVQIALEESGLPYERVWVGTEAADVERFRRINPTGKVPALQLRDGTVMFESAAILIHLAAQTADARLAPAPGTSRHAVFLQWMTFMSANLYDAALRLFYAARYSSRGDEDAAAIASRAEMDYASHLKFVGNVLNPYVLGADYSVADAYLHMIAAWFPQRAELCAREPNLRAHAEKLSCRPAVAKVEADHAAHA